jgi:hypothetical protein
MNQLVTPDKVANFCSQTLAGYCQKNNHTSVSLIKDTDNPERFFLQGGFPDITSGTHGQRLPIVLLQNNIWIHFSILFKRISKSNGKSHELKGVTLQFFQEQINEKVLLFRAEWDSIESNEFHHPQPHWHIHPEIQFLFEKQNVSAESFKEYMNLISDNGDSFENSINSNYFNKEHTGITNFHFAMACLWHNNFEDKAKIPLTEKNLYNWLKGCMQNICQQLKYIYSW